MIQKNSILCVDDDVDTVELLKMIFKLNRFSITSAMMAEEGLRYAEQGGFNAIILDNKLPDYSGADLCREIREFDSQTLIIFFSALAMERDSDKCLSAGAQSYLLKPDGVDTILDTIKQLMQQREQKKFLSAT